MSYRQIRCLRLFDEIVNYANFERIRAVFTSYKNARVLRGYIKEVTMKLIESYKVTGKLIDSLDMLMGKDTIPVMTVHKSKGLEYHTVIFVGLEDNAFWTFQRQPNEDKCTFFVALSRAKERVVFTFSKSRADHNGNIRVQKMDNIRVILEELQKSKIENFVNK